MFVDEVPAQTSDLPELDATPAQRKWATDVRNGKIKHCRKLVRDWQEYIALLRKRGTEAGQRIVSQETTRLQAAIDVLERLEQETSARFWLNHRDNTARELLSEAEAAPGDGYSDAFEPG